MDHDPDHEPLRVDRPRLPDGYGVPTTDGALLPWSDVRQRLVDSAQYWLATTRADGRPHVVPRWGVWLDDRLYYDGSPETLHARILRRSSACTLHLEDGWQAVIVDGEARPAKPPGLVLGGRIAAEMGRKYAAKDYAPAADAWEGEAAGGLCVFTPAKALAWFAFPTDVTRFAFPS